MILNSGRKSKRGIKKMQESGEMLTARAELGFYSQYMDNLRWVQHKLRVCGATPRSRPVTHNVTIGKERHQEHKQRDGINVCNNRPGTQTL